MSIMLSWGVRDGQMLHISEVESGKRCQCACPSCGDALIARKGTKTQWHFSHGANADCSGESNLHIVSKYLVRDLAINQHSLYLPPNTRDRFYIEGVEGITLEMNVADNEVALEGGIRPDVLVKDENGHLVAVEIMVTNKKDATAAAKYAAIDMDCVEIDLSGLEWDADRTTILAEINDPQRIRWINMSRQSRQKQRSQVVDMDTFNLIRTCWKIKVPEAFQSDTACRELAHLVQCQITEEPHNLTDLHLDVINDPVLAYLLQLDVRDAVDRVNERVGVDNPHHPRGRFVMLLRLLYLKPEEYHTLVIKPSWIRNRPDLLHYLKQQTDDLVRYILGNLDHLARAGLLEQGQDAKGKLQYSIKSIDLKKLLDNASSCKRLLINEDTNTQLTALKTRYRWYSTVSDQRRDTMMLLVHHAETLGTLQGLDVMRLHGLNKTDVAWCMYRLHKTGCIATSGNFNPFSSICTFKTLRNDLLVHDLTKLTKSDRIRFLNQHFSHWPVTRYLPFPMQYQLMQIMFFARRKMKFNGNLLLSCLDLKVSDYVYLIHKLKEKKIIETRPGEPFHPFKSELFFNGEKGIGSILKQVGTKKYR